jgi:hypothetical protein
MDELLHCGFLIKREKHLLWSKTLFQCNLNGKASNSSVFPWLLNRYLVLDCTDALGGLKVAGPVCLFERPEGFYEVDC